MKVEGEYTFDAPQPLVWEALQNPDVLGSNPPWWRRDRGNRRK